MTVHSVAGFDDNFGFPRESVLCSTDQNILSEYRKAGKSVIWRRPNLSADIHAYVDELCNDKRHLGKMRALHRLMINATVTPENNVTLHADCINGREIENMGIDGIPNTLSELFPEKNAGAFVDDLETRLKEDSGHACYDSYAMTVLFHTLGTGDVHYHKDFTPALGINYTDFGTELGEERDFTRHSYHNGETPYKLKPNSRLWELQAGDISILDLPHRGGGRDPERRRLWIGIYMS